MSAAHVASVRAFAIVGSGSECARCCESSRRSEFTFANIMIVAGVVSVAGVVMIKDVEILTFIANMLSVADVSIYMSLSAITLGSAKRSSPCDDGKERMCTSFCHQFTF